MFDELTSWANLLLAFHKAARGKRGQANVARFEHRLEANLLRLQEELRSGTYRPGGYHSFFVHEPKRRKISAAPFRDRVVHHALCNLIEPLFEPAFVEGSFANRKGKGTHRALDQCQQLARRYPFFLQLDVRQFFPSIDHEILLARLARRIRDPQVLELARSILESGDGVLAAEYEQVYFPGDDLFAALRPRGLPIGNLTSQFWANVYLDSLDHCVKRRLRCRGYLRYVDDFLLFAGSKQELWGWKRAIETHLESLRLKLHPGAHPRPVTEGIPFLGFVTYPDRRELKRRKGIHYRRRLKRLVAQARRMGNPAKALASLQGWEAHCRHGNTVGLLESVRREAGVGGLGRQLSPSKPALPGATGLES